MLKSHCHKKSIHIQKITILMQTEIEAYLNTISHEVSLKKMCTDGWIKIIKAQDYDIWLLEYLEKKMKNNEDVDFIKQIDFAGDFIGLQLEYDLYEEYCDFIEMCIEKEAIEWCKKNNISYNMEKLSYKESKIFIKRVERKTDEIETQKIEESLQKEKNEFCIVKGCEKQYEELKKGIDDPKKFNKLIKSYKLSGEWEEFCENYRKAELDEIHKIVDERDKNLNDKLKKLCEKYEI